MPPVLGGVKEWAGAGFAPLAHRWSVRERSRMLNYWWRMALYDALVWRSGVARSLNGVDDRTG